jgi:hypothetical protein
MRLVALAALALLACGGGTGRGSEATGDAANPETVAEESAEAGAEATPEAVTDATADAEAAAPPAWGAVNGWILLDSDPAAIAGAIEQAATYGVNHVQLSHDIIMNIEDLLGDDAATATRVQTINDAIALAHQHGMEAWIWAHELSGVSAAVCYEPGGELWQARGQAYRDGLGRIPGLDGVVLMFGSAPLPPWLTVCTCQWCQDGWPGATPFGAPPPEERLKLVIEQVGAVVTGELHKKLIARVFVHQPQENDWHAQGLAAVQGVDFMGMHKGSVQDWQPYNPFDPTLGNIGPHPAVVEMDVAGEYWGLSQLPFCAPGYFRYLMRHARDNGGVGSVIRVQRGSESALGTPNEVNVRAVTAFLADPDAPLGKVWEDHLQAEYGLTRGQPGYALLKRTLEDTFEVRLKSHYVLGIWALDKGSDLPDSTTLGEFNGRGEMPKWDADWQERWERLDRPDLGTVLDVWQEASEAVTLADAGLTAVTSLRDLLPGSGPLEVLERRLQHQYAAARAWRAVKLFIFTQRGLKADTLGAEQAPWLVWAHLELAAVRDAMQAFGLSNVRVASPGRIDEFLNNTKALLPADLPGQRPPAAPFLPLRWEEHLQPDAATLVLGATRALDARLEWGTDIPDYGQVEPAAGLGPGAPSYLPLLGLSPATRHVLRLTATLDGLEVHGGDTWLFTPAACDCGPDQACLDGQCVPLATCTPDCAGRCPGADDGCAGACVENGCPGCCAGAHCLTDPGSEFCP